MIIVYCIFGSILILIFSLSINIFKLRRLRKKLDFLKIIIDSIPNPVFFKDLKGEYTECNSYFEELIGLKRHEIIGKNVFEINQGDFANVYFWYDNKLLRNGGVQVYESKIKYREKEFKDVLISKSLIKFSNNELIGIVGIVTDITERKSMEKRINRISKLKSFMIEINHSIIGMNNIKELLNLILEKAIEVLDDAKYGSVLILDKSGVLKVAAHRGYDKEKMKKFSMPLEESFVWKASNGDIGHPVIVNYISALNYVNILDVCENEGKSIKACISTPIIVDGNVYGLLNIDSDKEDAFNEGDSKIIEYMATQVEISINKYNLYQKNIYLSKYDKLTNIYNRRHFENLLGKKMKENENFKLVIFDLNGLKTVNDKYGHLAGDEYIKTFVNKVKYIIGDFDIFARYGGDEFVAVFNEDDECLIRKFEIILENSRKNPLDFKGDKVGCSFSYGISTFPTDSLNYDELISIADKRMYTYKKKLHYNDRL